MSVTSLTKVRDFKLTSQQWREICHSINGLHITDAQLAVCDGDARRIALETALGHYLETFGLHLELPPGYDDDFARPPIDSTHADWAHRYPLVPSTRQDGRPAKERYASETSEDAKVLCAPAGASSNWPALESLKTQCRAASRKFQGAAAWESDKVDKAEFLLPAPSVSAEHENGGALSASNAGTQAASNSTKPGGASFTAKSKKGAAAAKPTFAEVSATKPPLEPLPYVLEEEQRRT